jgi:hypothetical protein
VEESLPNYEGHLTAPSWSEIKLTPSAVKSLREAALPGCDLCLGYGYIGFETVQICPCTKRPPAPDAHP